MTKYVYIVRRILDYSGKIEYEKAIADLDNAKEFLRERMAKYDITSWQQYTRLSQEEKDRIHGEYKNMPIKLREPDWTWTHYADKTCQARWELKRLEVKED